MAVMMIHRVDLSTSCRSTAAPSSSGAFMLLPFPVALCILLPQVEKHICKSHCPLRIALRQCMQSLDQTGSLIQFVIRDSKDFPAYSNSTVPALLHAHIDALTVAITTLALSAALWLQVHADSIVVHWTNCVTKNCFFPGALLFFPPYLHSPSFPFPKVLHHIPHDFPSASRGRG